MVRNDAVGSPSRLHTAHACVRGLVGVAPGVTRLQTGLQRGCRQQTGTRRLAVGVYLGGAVRVCHAGWPPRLRGLIEAQSALHLEEAADS